MKRIGRYALLMVANLTIAAIALLSSGRTAYADTPSGKEIAEVEVIGNKIRSSSDIITILGQSGVRVGQIYLDENVRQGVDRLMSRGWFTPNGIEVKVREMAGGKLRVNLIVSELTNLIEDIQYNGRDHLSDKELDELTGLRRGMPMSPHANYQARLNILRKYQESGRQLATVTLREGTRIEDRRVIFDIVEGPIVKIGDYEFKFLGRHESGITEGRLREQLTISRARLGGLIGGDFNTSQIDFDVQKLTEYYHGLGFLSARVQREIIYQEGRRYVKIVFHIDEGMRSKVGQVKINGNSTFTEEKLMSFTDLRPNQYYDRTTIQADLRRIRDLYGFTGRAIAVREEHPEPENGSGIVNVNYQVVEAPQSYVNRIYVEGNTVTRNNVIFRELMLFPGQVLEYPRIQASEDNLSRLGIFKEDPMNGIKPKIEVRDTGDPDSPFKDLIVRVQEAQTGSFLIGGGVNSDAGITGSAVLNERNFDLFNFPSSIEELLSGKAFRGAGQELRLEAVPGNVFQRYTVSWRDPRIFDSLFSLSLSGYYYNRGFFEYNEDRIGGRATLGRRIGQNWQATATARVEGVTVRDVPDFAPNDIRDDRGYSFLVGVGGGLRRDTRDNFLRPSNGSVLDFSFEQVLGDYNYRLGNAEYTNFLTTYSRLDGSGKHVLAFRSQASFASSDTPVYERYYAGGFRSIRGFQFRGVGPHVGDFNVGGDFALLNSLEYQIPLVPSDSLYVVGFVDSGTVERNVSLKDYRVTAGVGLRISMPQVFGPVPLALDFGFPIRQNPMDKKQVFSFWFGVFGQ